MLNVVECTYNHLHYNSYKVFPWQPLIYLHLKVDMAKKKKAAWYVAAKLKSTKSSIQNPPYITD